MEKEENQKLQKSRTHPAGWRTGVGAGGELIPPSGAEKTHQFEIRPTLWPTDRRAMSSTTEKLFSTAADVVVLFYRVWKGKCENNLAAYFCSCSSSSTYSSIWGRRENTDRMCVCTRIGEQKHFSGPQWTLFAVESL